MGKTPDDDRELFRSSVGEVRPLRRAGEAPPERPRPTPRARFRRADEAQALAESLSDEVDAAALGTGEELSYRRPGLQPGTLRRLRRGRIAVEAELDLHGMRVAEAKVALRDFLRAARETGRRCVRVVHGKGRGSGQTGPVLKPMVALWLRRRDDVLAYSSTPGVDGGTGAVYVLLKRAR